MRKRSIFSVGQVLFIVICLRKAESQVTITNQPSSRHRVLEGQPLTLEWTLNFDIGTTLVRLEFEIVGASRAIVEAVGGLKIIRDDRFKVNITETNTTILLLAVNRNDSNSYQFEVVASDGTSATANLEIIVEYPPLFATRAQDQVVLEGGPPIQLNCVADGEPKPNITWTKVNNGSDGDILFAGESFVLPNNRSNAGTYRCHASNGIGNDVNQTATVVVNFKPENFMFKAESTKENICKGDSLNITCSAEGKPAVHTYQLFQNNILVHTSKSFELFWSNATTVGGEVMYTCEANNTASTANTTRTVTVNVSSFIMTISTAVINEGGNLNLSCPATGIPPPTVFWIKTSNGERTIGTDLVIRNISRSEAGEYRCEATNPCGNALESATIDVQYPPEGIQLHVSEEEVCNGTSIFINCFAENANPMELNYKLYENNVMIGSISSTGGWYKTMAVGGVFVYKCMVNNSVGTAVSSAVSVNVNVSSFIMPISTGVINEGGNLNLSCPATGIPPPTVFWIKTSNGERTIGTDLVIRNISRSEAGEYRCEATNPCGNALESATIDVQYPPEGIQLHVSEEEICNGTTISFNCLAENANPMKLTYELYENNVMIGFISSVGVWYKTMAVGGVFVYVCMVNNFVGTSMSSAVSVTVSVPAFIMPISTAVINEGGNLNLSCPATSIPPPTVFWIKASNGERTIGTDLVLRNISRSEAGEYICEATTPCEVFLEFATIDVRYPPEGIQLHVGEEEVCNGTTISFNCSAENANPMELNYQLYENNVMIGSISSTGVWNKTMTVIGVFVYKCMVNNSVGTAMSSAVSVTVSVPAFIMPISTAVINEGGNLNLSCPATSIPTPTVFWIKASNGERTIGTDLVLRNISRSEAGEYICEATTPCEVALEFATIDVRYPPEGIQLHVGEEEVCNGTTISFNCSAENANPMELNYQLYENNVMIGSISSTGVWNKTMTVIGLFVYKCMVNNSVGTAMSSAVSVTVSVPAFIMPISTAVINEGGNLNLSCPATSIPTPTVFWIKASNGERTIGTDLVLRNISRSEAGEYICEATTPCEVALEFATIDVRYPPEGIQLHVGEEEVCNGTTISFNCSAENANPMELNYQLYENNVMIGSISSTGVWNKTMTVIGLFVYKCMVNNSVGTAMSSAVSVTVSVPAFIMPISTAVINEGGNLNLSCPATSIPPPTVFWIKASNGERTIGTDLVIRNISRSEAGEYICEATSPCGVALEFATIDVRYPPEGIQLHVGEEEVCNGTTISFNCSAENANPMELNYQLYENNVMIGSISSTGVWNKTMTVIGVFVYKCMVKNSVGTAVSSAVSVNVSVPSFIMPISTAVIKEGGNLNLSCPATSIPPPTVFWIKTSNGERTIGTDLVIRNISRSEGGEYICEATSPCGVALEFATIDVQYPPEVIQLHVGEEEVCNGTTISFNCSAENANPMELNYQLYENNVMIGSISSTGVWNKTMTVGGVFVYKCMVKNSVGTAVSSAVSVNVSVSSFVMPISTAVINEGGNLNLTCPATGIPPPTVFWIKTSNGERTIGTDLVIRNSSRNEAGEYRCEATNPCGNALESATIDVQYPPEGIQLHVGKEEVCNGTTISFNCSAETANPMELNYQLYENNVMIGAISSTGVWNKTMTVGGVFVYKCMVNNSVGTAVSSAVSVNVNVSSSIEAIKGNKKLTEGENLNLSCQASGYPLPFVLWIKDGGGQHTNSNNLVLTNIQRNQSGEYRCNASNSCNVDTKMVTVDVQYQPEITLISARQTVNKGDVVTLNCTANGNPAPIVRWTRLSDNSDVTMPLAISGKEHEGNYRCTASNSVGSVTRDTSIVVNFGAVIVPLVERIIVEKGDDVTLFCNASGMPPPSVMWTHVPKGRKQYSETWLITDIQVSDLGEYRCDANNTYGPATDAVTIEFKGALISLIIVAVVVVVFS
ncbi:hemicentin-1-like [Montipora foliosa]|uniref:hemicentin-1-like n=1 Tax=Montipora foliosa TaxID=591990 RepID=UPI0035F1D3F1